MRSSMLTSRPACTGCPVSVLQTLLLACLVRVPYNVSSQEAPKHDCHVHTSCMHDTHRQVSTFPHAPCTPSAQEKQPVGPAVGCHSGPGQQLAVGPWDTLLKLLAVNLKAGRQAEDQRKHLCSAWHGWCTCELPNHACCQHPGQPSRNPHSTYNTRRDTPGRCGCSSPDKVARTHAGSTMAAVTITPSSAHPSSCHCHTQWHGSLPTHLLVVCSRQHWVFIKTHPSCHA